MEIYSIGFTKSTAERFFSRIKDNKIERLIDIRLNNSSQLAGFAKKEDLAYFLDIICGAEYIHCPLLAPTKDILKAYQSKEIDWSEYEARFMQLLTDRKVEEKISKDWFRKPSVLLCSEATAEFCHRRLVLEYLKAQWPEIIIRHI